MVTKKLVQPAQPKRSSYKLEKEYGFFRPIIKQVVERYLDSGNPICIGTHYMTGQARIASLSQGKKFEGQMLFYTSV